MDDPSTHSDFYPDLWLEAVSFGGPNRNLGTTSFFLLLQCHLCSSFIVFELFRRYISVGNYYFCHAYYLSVKSSVIYFLLTMDLPSSYKLPIMFFLTACIRL